MTTPSAAKQSDAARAEKWVSRGTETRRKLSDHIRQLSIGGFAAIWVFKQDNKGLTVLPSELMAAGACLVLALAFDLAHGVFDAAIAMHAARYYREAASRGRWDQRLSSALFRAGLLRWLYSAKFASMILAYVFLVHYAWANVSSAR